MTHPFRSLASMAAAVALLLITALPVAAHATVPDGSEVPANGSAVIHVRIPHGCEGAAVTAVEVQLPDGVVGAKPAWIAGWTATTEKAPATYTLYGTEYTERVDTITWTGGPLPDGQFLDFGISASFQMEPGSYTLPVIQYCGSDSVAWIEVPAAGQDAHELERPAPTFTVVAAAADGHDKMPESSPAPDHQSETGSSSSTSDPLALLALFAAAAALVVSLRARRA